MAERRGVALIIVFLILMSAALLVTALIHTSMSQVRLASGTGLNQQAHALAWSGVQGVMAELDEQRADLLAGKDPHLTDSWTLYNTSTESGAVQLLPVGADGALCQSESAKLDVNTADADTLGKFSEWITPQLAQAIVKAREARRDRRFDSIADLLTVPGVTPTMIWGDPRAIRIQRAVDTGKTDQDRYADRINQLSGVAAGGALTGPARPRGLADVLTVFSVAPVLQSSGVYRININGQFDQQMRLRIEQRFDSKLADLVENAHKNDPKFHVTPAQFYQILSGMDFPSYEPDKYLDTFTLDDQQYEQGHVDILRAPEEVLAALPGMTADLAHAVAATRESLSTDQRQGLAWLVTNAGFTPEQWQKAAPKMTWRSTAFRVRVIGMVQSASLDRTQPVTLKSAVAYEAVIDLSTPRPRIAYLRDITQLESAVKLSDIVAQMAQSTSPWRSNGDALPGSLSAPNEAADGGDSASTGRDSSTSNGRSSTFGPGADVFGMNDLGRTESNGRSRLNETATFDHGSRAGADTGSSEGDYDGGTDGSSQPGSGRSDGGSPPNGGSSSGSSSGSEGGGGSGGGGTTVKPIGRWTGGQ